MNIGLKKRNSKIGVENKNNNLFVEIGINGFNNFRSENTGIKFNSTNPNSPLQDVRVRKFSRPKTNSPFPAPLNSIKNPTNQKLIMKKDSSKPLNSISTFISNAKSSGPRASNYNVTPLRLNSQGERFSQKQNDCPFEIAQIRVPQSTQNTKSPDVPFFQRNSNYARNETLSHLDTSRSNPRNDYNQSDCGLYEDQNIEIQTKEKRNINNSFTAGQYTEAEFRVNGEKLRNRANNLCQSASKRTSNSECNPISHSLNPPIQHSCKNKDGSKLPFLFRLKPRKTKQVKSLLPTIASQNSTIDSTGSSIQPPSLNDSEEPYLRTASFCNQDFCISTAPPQTHSNHSQYQNPANPHIKIPTHSKTECSTPLNTNPVQNTDSSTNNTNSTNYYVQNINSIKNININVNLGNLKNNNKHTQKFSNPNPSSQNTAVFSQNINNLQNALNNNIHVNSHYNAKANVNRNLLPPHSKADPRGRNFKSASSSGANASNSRKQLPLSQSKNMDKNMQNMQGNFRNVKAASKPPSRGLWKNNEPGACVVKGSYLNFRKGSRRNKNFNLNDFRFKEEGEGKSCTRNEENSKKGKASLLANSRKPNNEKKGAYSQNGNLEERDNMITQTYDVSDSTKIKDMSELMEKSIIHSQQKITKKNQCNNLNNYINSIDSNAKVGVKADVNSEEENQIREEIRKGVKRRKEGEFSKPKEFVSASFSIDSTPDKNKRNSDQYSSFLLTFYKTNQNTPRITNKNCSQFGNNQFLYYLNLN
jgi:hypothetical protein